MNSIKRARLLTLLIVALFALMLAGTSEDPKSKDKKKTPAAPSASASPSASTGR